MWVKLGAVAFLFSQINACGSEKTNSSLHLVMDQTGLDAVVNAGIPVEQVDTIGVGEFQVIVPVDSQDDLSFIMHKDLNRCGGFFQFEGESDIESAMIEKSLTSATFTPSYSISNEATVTSALRSVNPISLMQVVTKLSEFQNRYYKSEFGVASQEWLAEYWRELIKNRKDARVELVQHKSWSQPSVVLTIEGSDLADEQVILGGHGDSITMSLFGKAKAKAPGADDNASGIAVLTEAIRVIVDNNYYPSRTLKFMSYAAEEVGLRGSKEIATQTRRDDIKVAGVIQFDMTNFVNGDVISVLEDYTDEGLTAFLGNIIEKYVKVPWIKDRCGYACSDHASWHAQKYPVAVPFETAVSKRNRKIHSKNDTIQNMDATGTHASHFAKMAVAFAMEVGK